MVAKRIVFKTGFGYHRSKLGSFEMALRDVGIEKQNLVMVSSIFPPGCEFSVDGAEFNALKPGDITYCVMARENTNEPGRIVSASIGVAIPLDNCKYGYLSEVHGFGKTEDAIGNEAEDIAVELLASTLGLEIDLDKSWMERKEQWMIDGKIYKSESFPIAKVGADEQWLTVLSVAVFIL